MKWSECKNRRIVKKVEVDKELVSSLVGISNDRLVADGFVPLNDVTASIRVANNYDAMREVLEAIAISKGFKIYNHDCFVGFIQEVLGMDREASRFDKFRKIRNSINYSGKHIGVSDAENLIGEILELRDKLMGLLK